MGILGFGYTGDDGQKVSALRDMFDGGGAGRYGDTFQGGPYSGILNTIGVRPIGYAARQERMGAVRPQARPAPQQAAPQPAPQPVMTRRDWGSMPSAPNYPQMDMTPLEAYLAGQLTRWTPAYPPSPITVTPLLPGNTRTLDSALGPAYIPRHY